MQELAVLPHHVIPSTPGRNHPGLLRIKDDPVEVKRESFVEVLEIKDDPVKVKRESFVEVLEIKDEVKDELEYGEGQGQDSRRKSIKREENSHLQDDWRYDEFISRLVAQSTCQIDLEDDEDDEVVGLGKRKRAGQKQSVESTKATKKAEQEWKKAEKEAMKKAEQGRKKAEKEARKVLEELYISEAFRISPPVSGTLGWYVSEGYESSQAWLRLYASGAGRDHKFYGKVRR